MPDHLNNIPAWPNRLTRQQAREAKERKKTFEAALKQGSKAVKWRYANEGIFRKEGDWFVSVQPSLLWQRGTRVRIMTKPMSLDPQFWSVVGLDENNQLPLSFRANGAWTLWTPFCEECLALNSEAPEELAQEVLRWSDAQAAKANSLSIDGILSEVRELRRHGGRYVATEVCLLLLQDDFDGALQVLRSAPPEETGGFTTGNPDGSSSSFIDQAHEWIARQRRSRLAVL